MRDGLPQDLFVLDEERLRVRLCDWLDGETREAIRYFIEDEVVPLGEAPKGRFPAPVRPHVLVGAHGPRAMATITCQGWRITVSTRDGLDEEHPMRALDLAPLEVATAPATVRTVLRWWLGCGRLGAWRLGQLLEERDGVDAVAVSTVGPAEIEEVAKRLGCEGVLLAPARSVCRDAAGGDVTPAEPAVEVVPCKIGLPGRMTGFLWRAIRPTGLSISTSAPRG